MRARVFVRRERRASDLGAASDAVRLIVAATIDDSAVAKASALLPDLCDEPRDNVVNGFCRTVERLDLALRSAPGLRRPFGAGELVVFVEEPARLTHRIRDSALAQIAALEAIADEIDLRGGFVAAGIIPLPLMEIDGSADDLIRVSLAHFLGPGIGSARYFAEAPGSDRGLAGYGRRLAVTLFLERTIADAEAVALARDALTVLSPNAATPQALAARRSWEEVLELLGDDLAAGRLEPAWELVNDLTAEMARMRIRRDVSP